MINEEDKEKYREKKENEKSGIILLRKRKENKYIFFRHKLGSKLIG